MERFSFYANPWENSQQPTLVRESPTGGDPHIVATFARVQNPDALHELCALANAAMSRVAPGVMAALKAAEGHLEETRQDERWHPIGHCPVLDQVRVAIAELEQAA